jgi:hypothetical protein
LLGQDPGFDLKTVVQAHVPANLKERHEGARFGVARSEYDAPDPCIDQRARAHWAGLERNEHGSALETPVTELGCSGAQREELGVRGRVSPFFAPIVVARQLDAVGIDDHTADWNVAVLRGAIGFFQRLQHPPFVTRLRASFRNFGHPRRL